MVDSTQLWVIALGALSLVLSVVVFYALRKVLVMREGVEVAAERLQRLEEGLKRDVGALGEDIAQLRTAVSSTASRSSTDLVRLGGLVTKIQEESSETKRDLLTKLNAARGDYEKLRRQLDVMCEGGGAGGGGAGAASSSSGVPHTPSSPHHHSLTSADFSPLLPQHNGSSRFLNHNASASFSGPRGGGGTGLFDSLPAAALEEVLRAAITGQSGAAVGGGGSTSDPSALGLDASAAGGGGAGRYVEMLRKAHSAARIPPSSAFGIGSAGGGGGASPARLLVYVACSSSGGGAGTAYQRRGLAVAYSVGPRADETALAIEPAGPAPASGPIPTALLFLEDILHVYISTEPMPVDGQEALALTLTVRRTGRSTDALMASGAGDVDHRASVGFAADHSGIGLDPSTSGPRHRLQHERLEVRTGRGGAALRTAPLKVVLFAKLSPLADDWIAFFTRTLGNRTTLGDAGGIL